jgi:capsular polysaccharide biosynthesis protein
VGLTTILVVQQPWIYQSEGTFVVRPRTVEADEIVRAFDTLNRGIEINATYAAIAKSDLVKQRARESVGSSTRGLNIGADIVPGTNMIRISVTGTDPDLVHDFASAISEETQRYVFELDDAFVLESLDEPAAPDRPVGPNKGLTIGVGVVFGLLLGAFMAVVLDYLTEATGRKTTLNIIDPATGAFNASYFELRRSEELARIDGNGRFFSIGEIRARTRTDPPQVPKPSHLRDFIEQISAATRAEDIICVTDPGVVSIIFPELPGSACERLLDDWRVLLEATLEVPLEVQVHVQQHGQVAERQAQDTAWT